MQPPHLCREHGQGLGGIAAVAVGDEEGFVCGHAPILLIDSIRGILRDTSRHAASAPMTPITSPSIRTP